MTGGANLRSACALAVGLSLVPWRDLSALSTSLGRRKETLGQPSSLPREGKVEVAAWQSPPPLPLSGESINLIGVDIIREVGEGLQRARASSHAFKGNDQMTGVNHFSDSLVRNDPGSCVDRREEEEEKHIFLSKPRRCSPFKLSFPPTA